MPRVQSAVAEPLPQVSPVQGQGVFNSSRLFPQRMIQGHNLRQPTHSPVAAGIFFEIEAGKRIGLNAFVVESCPVQQRMFHQVRQFSLCLPDANIDIGFTKIHWPKLGMYIRGVQNPYIARHGQLVQVFQRFGAGLFHKTPRPAVTNQRAGSGKANQLKQRSSV